MEKEWNKVELSEAERFQVKNNKGIVLTVKCVVTETIVVNRIQLGILEKYYFVEEHPPLYSHHVEKVT